MWAIVITFRPSVNISHFNLLLRNHWTNKKTNNANFRASVAWPRWRYTTICASGHVLLIPGRQWRWQIRWILRWHSYYYVVVNKVKDRILYNKVWKDNRTYWDTCQCWWKRQLNTCKSLKYVLLSFHTLLYSIRSLTLSTAKKIDKSNKGSIPKHM
jgi:hypothetical protein